MKFGLKLYSVNIYLVKEYSDIFDFFEIYIPPDLDLSILKQYKKYNLTIHMAHNGSGFDIGNPEKDDINKAVVKKAKEASIIINSPWIIMHPESITNYDLEYMNSFLKKNHQENIVYENLIPVKNRGFSTPEDMSKLLNMLDAKMVFDFGHAICTANILGINPNSLIHDFFLLNPKTFHISGIDIDSKLDQHKHFFEVNNDFSYILDIPKDSYITFETGLNGLDDKNIHIKNLNLIKEIIKNNKKKN
jgi:hypothetical protein